MSARLDHQDHRSIRRTCAMARAFRTNEALPRRKIDNVIFKVDQKCPVETRTKNSSMSCARASDIHLNHRQSDDRIGHLAKRMVCTFVRASTAVSAHRLVQAVRAER